MLSGAQGRADSHVPDVQLSQEAGGFGYMVQIAGPGDCKSRLPIAKSAFADSPYRVAMTDMESMKIDFAVFSRELTRQAPPRSKGVPI